MKHFSESNFVQFTIKMEDADISMPIKAEVDSNLASTL